MSKNKPALKEAREQFAQKNYKDVLRICKRILKEDKSNYNALVLLSAAMQEIDDLKSQAPIALKKAVAVQPDNPLAWQGLIYHYEKEPDNVDAWLELIPAYSKLLQIERNSPKYEHFLTSCADLVLRIKNNDIFHETIKCLQTLRQSFIEEHSDKLKLLDSTLASLLTQQPNLSNNYDDLLESVLSSIIYETNSNNKQEYYKKYLKVLYKLQKYDILLDEASKMYNLFPEDTYPLEWICRTYAEQCILCDTCNDFDVTEFSEKLLSFNKSSIFALLSKAVRLYHQKSYIESRNILNYIVSVRDLLHAWVLLSEVNLKLYCWELAENAAIKAHNLLTARTEKTLVDRVNVNLITSMIKSNKKHKWHIAMQKCNNLLTSDIPQHLLLIVRACVLIKDPQASAMLARLDNYSELKVESTILQATYLMSQDKLEEAADVLDIALCTSEAWLLLGKIYWKLSDYGHSLMAFLKGVHTDPNNWECLVYLGNYYKEFGNDLERSKKCYQKALEINPNAEEAGIGLSTVYRLLEDNEANIQLLHRLTAEGSGPKWAWLQLGLQKLQEHDTNDAVKFLRCAIRTDPNDSHCWETLADAYFARGAYISSMKSYQRALELCPESFYSEIQIANILLLLGQYEDAKSHFQRVIEKKEDNVAALKGLAETHLGLAQQESENQLLARARDNIQLTVDYLSTAIMKRSEFSCLWKLLGDACYSMSKLPDKYCYLYISPILIKSESLDKRVEIRKNQILQCTVRYYCRALNISKDSSLLWHNLGVAYFMQLKLDPSIDKQDIIKRCLSAVKYSIRLCPTSWIHWNLLGVICISDEIKNFALAQHCFVMAIDLEHNNAISWSNLGCLYLILDDKYRANEAFSWAQSIDPAYVNSWVGQALIAEKVHSREAMDLFRHATQLSYQSQGAIGYTHWVLSTILHPEAKKDPLYMYSIVKMHAIPTATDSISWYIVHNPTDSYSLNACGLLLERQKLYRSAKKHFSASLENACNDVEKDAASTNLARVLVKLGDYDAAINLCQKIKNANFNSHCQLALALFKAERYEESYSSYEFTLEWLADTDSDKAHVLCAMAAMAYMFESIEDVKTLLFQCIKFKPHIVSGLLAAAALGLLHDDKNLTFLTLKELSVLEDNQDHRHHIALLSAYSSLLENDVNSAVRILVKIIHKHPGDARLWICLVRFLINLNSKAFEKCAQKALFLGKDMPEISIIQVASLISFSDSMKNPQNGLRSTLKTVHSFPGNIESWANLISVLLPQCSVPNSQPNLHWLTILISTVRKELPCSRKMMHWLLNNEKYASLIADKVSNTT